MYSTIKYLLVVFISFLFSFQSYSQALDTIYVTQIDTVVIKEPDVIVNTIYYQEKVYKEKNKTIEFILSIGGIVDFSHYEVCEVCEENFNVLRSAYSNTKSTQLGLQLNYLLNRFSIGVNANYRNSVKKINYNNNSIVLNTHTTVSYLMVGPSVSYKILQKSKWDIDLYSSLLFSFTSKQRGETIGGKYIDKIIDINTEKLIAKTTILYHFAPALTYKLNTSTSVGLITHYYVDLNSNISTNKNYSEYRNSIGLSLAGKYLF